MSNFMINNLDNFHKKFGFEKRKEGTSPDRNMLGFRLKFIMEELDEINKGMAKDDLAEVLDGLVDIVYVALGTAWLLNLPFGPAWDAVHRANMEKVRATDAKQSARSSTFDVVKPKGWKKPDIRSLLPLSDQALKMETTKRGVQPRQVDLIQYINELKQKEIGQ